MSKKNMAIGFIGLGMMGTPMSLRLRKAGYHLTVWNRTKIKTKPLLEAGAELADSPASVAEASDIVFLCLTDSEAVENVLFGHRGVTQGGSGKLLVDHSTISPEAAVSFAARLRKNHNFSFIDAPVTGGVIGATNGTLTVFAGGKAADIDVARPTISHLAEKFLHMGAHGAGLTTKLCNQVMVMTTLVAMAEMLKLAENGGIDPTQVPAILANGFANSEILQVFGPPMALRSTEITGRLAIAEKDLNLIRAAGQDTGTPLPMCSTATELVRLAIADGLGDGDVSQFIKLYD